MTTRFVLFIENPDKSVSIADIVEAKDKYRPKFFRSMSRQCRSGEASFFIVGNADQQINFDTHRKIIP